MSNILSIRVNICAVCGEMKHKQCFEWGSDQCRSCMNGKFMFREQVPAWCSFCSTIHESQWLRRVSDGKIYWGRLKCMAERINMCTYK